MDKSFYKQIFSLECSFEELEDFNVDIDKLKFDDNDSFEKYYDIEIIINAVRKYQEEKIDEKYLSYWANLYNWLIMASEWKENKCFDFKAFIKSCISYALDSLSFFEDWCDDAMCNDLDAFIRGIKFYDNILKNIVDYKVFYRPLTGEYVYNNSVYIVAVNDKEMKYVKFRDGVLNYKDYDVGNELDIHEMASMVKQLNLKGYKIIK